MSEPIETTQEIDAEVTHNSVPIRTDSVQFRKVGDDTLLMHRVIKQYHVLNGVAGRIWELADGSNSAADISHALVKEYDISRDVVEADVQDTIAGLLRLQVIELR